MNDIVCVKRLRQSCSFSLFVECACCSARLVGEKVLQRRRGHGTEIRYKLVSFVKNAMTCRFEIIDSDVRASCWCDTKLVLRFRPLLAAEGGRQVRKEFHFKDIYQLDVCLYTSACKYLSKWIKHPHISCCIRFQFDRISVRTQYVSHRALSPRFQHK